MKIDGTDDTSGDAVTWSQWVGLIVVVNVIFIGLEYLVYRALAPLEHGEPEGTAVWAPIAIVYELFGFGAAMSVIPTLCILGMSIIGWQTWARIKHGRK